MGIFDRIKAVLAPVTTAPSTPPPSVKKPASTKITLRPPVRPVRMDDIRLPLEAKVLDEILRSKAGAALYRAWQEEEKKLRGGHDAARIAHLRHALRCTPETYGTLHRMVQFALGIAGSHSPYEVYFGDPSTEGAGDLNAMCIWAKDRFLLSMTPRLFGIMNQHELLTVIGHEVGHYCSPNHRFSGWLMYYLTAYGQDPEQHHADKRAGDVVAKNICAGDLPERICWLAQLGEFSCDRLGLLCAQARDPAITGAAKLQAAPDSPQFHVSAADFLRQAEELVAASVGLDPYDSHPPMTVRARALDIFFHSELYARYFPHGSVRYSADQAEAEIQKLASLAVEDEESSGMDQRVEFTAIAAYILASVDGSITQAEERAVKRLPGGDALLEFWDDYEKASEKELSVEYERRSDAIAEVCNRRELATAMGWLIQVARADGRLSAEEVSCLKAIAEDLGVEDLCRRRLERVVGKEALAAMWPDGQSS